MSVHLERAQRYQDRRLPGSRTRTENVVRKLVALREELDGSA